MDHLRIIVLGYVVRAPLGGVAWGDLQTLQGLAKLGHDVYFVEDSGDSPWCCYDPVASTNGTDPTYGLQFAGRVFERIGFRDRWAYYDAHTSRWLGPYAERMVHICATANLLLNLGGANALRPWLMGIPARALVDEDPAFTQIENLTDSGARERAGRHTAFFTFGENVGLGSCAIPDDGLRWMATRQPVVLDAWPATPGPVRGKFTTVAQWEAYPAREYEGVRYGMKSDSFEPYMDLPARAGRVFELAVGGASAPRDRLAQAGWIVRDPARPTRDPWTYQRYIRQSKAEFSVAKHGYVVSRSGWFSERSVAYLASGRPALLQDTGFSHWLPVGTGVVAFNTPEEALAGIADINSRYELHCRAARDIAEEYFDARKVLSELIHKAMDFRSALAVPSPGRSGLADRSTL